MFLQLFFSPHYVFLSGIVFAYFVMLPLTLAFAGQFGTTAIENNFAIDEYFSIIISVMLAAGVIFELPMLILLSIENWNFNSSIYEEIQKTFNSGNINCCSNFNTRNRSLSSGTSCNSFGFII